MGQTILLVPADYLAWQTLNLFKIDDPEVNENVRETLVTNLTFPALTAATIALSFLLLVELNFSLVIALLGAIFLFFGTTFLHYSQVHQENSQIIFLDIGGYYMLLKWVRLNRWLHLVIGSALFGTLLLFRITAFADIVAGAVFVTLVLFWKEKPDFSKEAIRRFVRFGLTFGGVVGFYFLLDRLFQYYRFGSFTSNYISVMVDQLKTGEFIYHPNGNIIPPDWPYNLPALTGIVNVLFSPEKSIFIYDPLLIVLGLTVLIRHFRLDTIRGENQKKAFVLSGVVCLLIYLVGYSKVEFWGGDDAWAARYHTSPVQLLCLLAVPLFLEIAPRLNMLARVGIKSLIGLACFFQLCSIVFWVSLEIQQHYCGIGTDFRVVQRIITIIQVFSGTYNPPADCVGVQADNLIIFWPFQITMTYLPAVLKPALTYGWLVLLIGTGGAFVLFACLALKAKTDEQTQTLILQPARRFNPTTKRILK
jgi:hypothetical protein